MKKTNACRFLDKNKVEYELLGYEVDEEDLSALHVAQVTNTDVKMIFKTLVCVDEKNTPLVACIAGDEELDLKALAKLAGVKKCVMIAQKELLGLTGYIRGGCSPFGMKKQYRTFIDSNAFLHQKILVSAGERGKQLKINPEALVTLLKAKQGMIIH
jgi:Cys-tRNA(Pro)/Cys-tRNA(Cys) deacylase